MLTKLLTVEMKRRGQIKEMSLNQSPKDLLIKPCGMKERVIRDDSKGFSFSK